VAALAENPPLIHFGKDETTIPCRKSYLHNIDTESFASVFYRDGRAGTLELESLVGKGMLEFPKDVDVIKTFIQLACGSDSLDNDDASSTGLQVQEPPAQYLIHQQQKALPLPPLILDFFGGSGTTAQAVLDLNAQDGGNRKFILVQIPEQTPENSEARRAGYGKISDITIERVRRVIAGYGSAPKPLDAGFKVFRLTRSHFPRADFAPDPDQTEAENVATLRAYIAEKEAQLTGLFEPRDIIDEVLLKNRFKLHYALSDAPEFTANKVLRADDGERQTLLCLDLKLYPETVGALLKNPQAFICLERALDTADKWNLRNHLGYMFTAF
jgi:adenine-specific DNA-methyltransferase